MQSALRAVSEKAILSPFLRPHADLARDGLSGDAVRLYQDVQQIVGSEADLTGGHTEDARVAGSEHLDAGAAAQAELFEPVHVVGLSGDATYEGRLTGLEIAEWDGFIDHDGGPERAQFPRVN